LTNIKPLLIWIRLQFITSAKTVNGFDSIKRPEDVLNSSLTALAGLEGETLLSAFIGS
jgi:hypothetical protein